MFRVHGNLWFVTNNSDCMLVYIAWTKHILLPRKFFHELVMLLVTLVWRFGGLAIDNVCQLR